MCLLFYVEFSWVLWDYYFIFSLTWGYQLCVCSAEFWLKLRWGLKLMVILVWLSVNFQTDVQLLYCIFNWEISRVFFFKLEITFLICLSLCFNTRCHGKHADPGKEVGERIRMDFYNHPYMTIHDWYFLIQKVYKSKYKSLLEQTSTQMGQHPI